MGFKTDWRGLRSWDMDGDFMETSPLIETIYVRYKVVLHRDCVVAIQNKQD
jgi:hypothetical protein